MALAEIAVHGHDITAGLGRTWQPGDDIARQMLSRLFPATIIDMDPWQLLLWAHNRIALDDRAPQTTWTWRLGQVPPVAAHTCLTVSSDSVIFESWS